MKLLTGRTCVVVGGGRGIGAAIATAFAAQGALVTIGYASNRSAAESTATSIANAGGTVEVTPLDITQNGMAANVAESVAERHGRLDVWVNNAAIKHDGLLASVSEATHAEVLDTNLGGVVRGTRAACRHMISRRSGSILNISSVAAVHPRAGQATYAASKGGVDALTRAMAVELAPRSIRVNAVAPGFVNTDLTRELIERESEALHQRIPLGRVGAPHEIAEACVFLVSDLAKYITGQILYVDGGLTL